MKIVGILSWYDEVPHWLATAVTGFARVCDQIVAVDGAYALLPGARPCSHPQQAEAVLMAAESAGVGCLVHRPNKLFFGNEVEKRNLTLKLAAPFLEEGDWIIVFDADCHVFKVDPIRVRGRLEKTKALIASYTFLQVEDMFSDPEMARIVRDDDYATESTSRTRDIYRWHPSLMYGPQHWILSREFPTRPGIKERRWVRHSSDGVEEICDLNADLVVYHRSKDRAMVRRMSQDGYYKARTLHGVEDMVEGDPVVNGLPIGVSA
jgi:hypothetical protein